MEEWREGGSEGLLSVVVCHLPLHTRRDDRLLQTSTRQRPAFNPCPSVARKTASSFRSRGSRDVRPEKRDAEENETWLAATALTTALSSTRQQAWNTLHSKSRRSASAALSASAVAARAAAAWCEPLFWKSDQPLMAAISDAASAMMMAAVCFELARWRQQRSRRVWLAPRGSFCRSPPPRPTNRSQNSPHARA